MILGLITINKFKFLLINLFIIALSSNFKNVEAIPAVDLFANSELNIRTESFSEENLETMLESYIPDFLKDIFSSYEEENYGYRIILLFLLVLVLFLVNITFIVLIIVYSNKKQNYSDRYIMTYKNMYENALLKYFIGETEWEQTLKKLKKSNLPQNRELLTSILMNLHENLRGIAEEMIPDIFIKLRLHEDALKQVNSKLYYEKVLGIKKLTMLYPEGAIKIIPGLVNDPDELVRAEAQTSFVRLHPQDPFSFLKELNKSFTRWTQLTAFYLYKLHRETTPTFADYLNTENTNVRNFSLRMIIFFQQLENIPEILKMLESKVDSTRFLAIKAVNDLRLYDGKPLLKNMFDDESITNQVEIVKAFKNIGNNEDFDFLEKIVLMNNVSLKLEVCRSLQFMGPEGVDRLSQINNKMAGELDMFIAHISDPRN